MVVFYMKFNIISNKNSISTLLTLVNSLLLLIKFRIVEIFRKFKNHQIMINDQINNLIEVIYYVCNILC